jgi:hypothetical protein
LPSLPVRGFGEDGLLVTGGVGASAAAESKTITGSGAQVGLLGVQTAAALVAVQASGGGCRWAIRPTVARGAQVGLLGMQQGTADVFTIAATNRMAVLFDLDEDLAAAA